MGRKYLEDYGPVKFWSALHRAHREGYWSETEVISLPVKRKSGLLYTYSNIPTTVYKLEHELAEVRKALEDIGADGPISNSAEELNRRLDTLESTISKKASNKSEQELMEAAEKWFKSLE